MERGPSGRMAAYVCYISGSVPGNGYSCWYWHSGCRERWERTIRTVTHLPQVHIECLTAMGAYRFYISVRVSDWRCAFLQRMGLATGA